MFKILQNIYLKYIEQSNFRNSSSTHLLRIKPINTSFTPTQFNPSVPIRKRYLKVEHNYKQYPFRILFVNAVGGITWLVMPCINHLRGHIMSNTKELYPVVFSYFLKGVLLRWTRCGMRKNWSNGTMTFWPVREIYWRRSD